MRKSSSGGIMSRIFGRQGTNDESAAEGSGAAKPQQSSAQNPAVTVAPIGAVAAAVFGRKQPTDSLNSSSGKKASQKSEKAPLLKHSSVLHSAGSETSSSSSGSSSSSSKRLQQHSRLIPTQPVKNETLFKKEATRFWQRTSRTKYMLCVMLPLLLVTVLVGGGLGAWAWLRKQEKHSMAAGPVGQPLMFEVTMAVPARQQRSCDSWFGSREVSRGCQHIQNVSEVSP
jgi:hypothetical protein